MTIKSGLALNFLQTIDHVMSIEDKFFPLIAGDLGTSSETAEKYQKQLEAFTPQIKVVFSIGFSGNIQGLEIFKGSLT